jgi:hypothetical protein
MSDRRVAAAFFLPAGPESARQLLTAAGAVDVADGPTDISGLIYCGWAGVAAQGVLDERGTQRLLVIFLPQSTFIAMLPGGADLLTAFTAACEALHPPVAVVVTHPHQADLDELWRLSGAVLEADAARLARERLGLLYVSDAIAAYQDGPWYTGDRETADAAGGTLVFAGQADQRWW